MFKIFIGKTTNNSFLPLLKPYFDVKPKEKLHYQKKAFKYYQEPVFKLCKDPEEADFFLMPHNFLLVRSKKDYLEEYMREARRHKKRVIIFYYSDNNDPVPFKEAIVFRTSKYKSALLPNEIIMPAYAEDLKDQVEAQKLSFLKKRDQPHVGFCGWAGVQGVHRQALMLLKNLLYLMAPYHQSGVLLRKRAMKTLKKSPQIQTDFIHRKTSSSHKETISVSPEKARHQFIQNILSNDFTLTMKGDGNYSIRFYEVLSLGRIPLFIDTDCPLPLENDINYNDFVYFTDYKNLSNLAEGLSKFYSELSEDDFQSMQKKARRAFEQYLRIDKFFEIMFLEKKLLNYIELT